jgi:hypothetical protein
MLQSRAAGDRRASFRLYLVFAAVEISAVLAQYLRKSSLETTRAESALYEA